MNPPATTGFSNRLTSRRRTSWNSNLTVEANGGKIVMPKFHIPTVGTLVFFEDTEGNVVGAMQYEEI